MVSTDAKLDRILEKLGEHSVILERHSVWHEKNTDDLAEHIRRTQLLEDRLKPMERHVTAVNTTVKVFMWLVGTAGVLIGLVKALKS